MLREGLLPHELRISPFHDLPAAGRKHFPDGSAWWFSEDGQGYFSYNASLFF
jgi:hypothetical protein